jgi:hypothetical protein
MELNVTKTNQGEIKMETIQDLKLGMETKRGRVISIMEIGTSLRVGFLRTPMGFTQIAHEMVTNDSVKEL